MDLFYFPVCSKLKVNTTNPFYFIIQTHSDVSACTTRTETNPELHTYRGRHCPPEDLIHGHRQWTASSVETSRLLLSRLKTERHTTVQSFERQHLHYQQNNITPMTYNHTPRVLYIATKPLLVFLTACYNYAATVVVTVSMKFCRSQLSGFIMSLTKFHGNHTSKFLCLCYVMQSVDE